MKKLKFERIAVCEKNLLLEPSNFVPKSPEDFLELELCRIIKLIYCYYRNIHNKRSLKRLINFQHNRFRKSLRLSFCSTCW